MASEDQVKDLLKAHRKAEVKRSAENTNRYPHEFKSKVLEVFRKGVSLSTIHRTTGINMATLRSWSRKKFEVRKSELIPIKVVDDRPSQSIVVFLPSGVEIEIPPEMLNRSLLQWLVNPS